MHCKGFLKPKDICLVDMEGKQLAGKKKRSSEVLLHLEIMKARPDVQSVVHCHPPHATAFAVAREPIPQAVLPEVEVFLGEVPIAPYETPGGKKFAETILPFVQAIERDHPGQPRHGELRRIGRAGLLVDRDPRRLLPHSDPGPAAGADPLLSPQKTQELLDLKAKWGFTDPRLAEGFAGDIRDNATFRHTWASERRRAAGVCAADGRRCVASRLLRARSSQAACWIDCSVAPTIKKRFCGEVSPAISSIADFGTPSALLSTAMIARFALPFSGAAVTAMRSAPCALAEDRVSPRRGVSPHRQNRRRADAVPVRSLVCRRRLRGSRSYFAPWNTIRHSTTTVNRLNSAWATMQGTIRCVRWYT